MGHIRAAVLRKTIKIQGELTCPLSAGIKWSMVAKLYFSKKLTEYMSEEKNAVQIAVQILVQGLGISCN